MQHSTSEQAQKLQEGLIIVAPVLKKIARVAMGDTIVEPLEDPENSYQCEDSAFERTLCATWDLSTVKDYATVLYQSHLSRMLLKIIALTSRARTRELAIGILANLSCHYDQIGSDMTHDIDVFKLCRSILWHENDARVLLESMRLLSNLYLYGVTCRSEVSKKGNNGLVFLLKPTDDILPSVIHQISMITINTLHTGLLLTSLQLLTHITQFLCYFDDDDDDDDIIEDKAITNDDEIETKHVMALALSQMKHHQVAKLVDWGLDRLEEQSRGVGIGMGFNRSIARHVMHILWLFFYHDLVVIENEQERATCLDDDFLTRRLKPSMQTIVEYIQQEDALDKSSEDEEIEQLAGALGQFLIV